MGLLKSADSESLGLLPLWFERRAWFISDKAKFLFADLSGSFYPENFFSLTLQIGSSQNNCNNLEKAYKCKIF